MLMVKHSKDLWFWIKELLAEEPSDTIDKLEHTERGERMQED